MNRGSIGMHRGTTGMNQGSTRKVLKCLIPPGRTVNDRRGTGNNQDGTGNNSDGTVAPPEPIQTPAELRQRISRRRWWQSSGIATVHR
ncbi:hypothetical protein DPMN_172083 [Dreissena polymorpha]|uniref:Uncharacterized protein n=1 Tax=Dreissena polymorpha TaxID=45954 RepID=A0A9D4E2G1_DREPO|nr:hypothetical protein DPMN_172083 [Dreissena polymorpha]